MKKLIKHINQIQPISRLVFFDIGSRGGIQVPMSLVPDTYLQYYGFEPDENECAALNKTAARDNMTFLPYMLLDVHSQSILYITKNPKCSSFYKPNAAFISKFYYGDTWDIAKELQWETRTLKEICEKHTIQPDFIKVDTEGAELKIIQGLGDKLDAVLGLEIEVEFNPIYTEQPLFSDVDSYMRSRGFELFDLNRRWAHRASSELYCSNRGQIIAADAIYFRTLDSFYTSSLQKDRMKEHILKMVLLLALYGYFDVAIDFIYHVKSPFTPNEQQSLRNELTSMCIIPWPVRLCCNNKIAKKIGKWIMQIGNLVHYKHRIDGSGWGSDYANADGRYPYFRSSRCEWLLKK